MPVYFDDLTVDHKSRVVQQLDYYPFGLEMAHSWEQLPNSVANPFRYNAGSEKNDKTGNYETLFRQYDPAIGRMLAVDPVAVKYASLTPYNYALNDPIYWNDPYGDDVVERDRGQWVDNRGSHGSVFALEDHIYVGSGGHWSDGMNPLDNSRFTFGSPNISANDWDKLLPPPQSHCSLYSLSDSDHDEDSVE